MTRLPRPCPGPGDGSPCGALIEPPAKRCHDCTRAYERRRGTVTERFGSGWGTVSRKVIARDGGICQLALPGCTGRATTADHLTPRSQGGTNDLDNLQAACRPCNSSKGAR